MYVRGGESLGIDLIRYSSGISTTVQTEPSFIRAVVFKVNLYGAIANTKAKAMPFLPFQNSWQTHFVLLTMYWLGINIKLKILEAILKRYRFGVVWCKHCLKLFEVYTGWGFEQ